MRYYCLVISFCLLLTACSLAPVYYGSKLKPTTSIDIFYSVKDVRRHYEVIGFFTIHNYPESTIKRSLTKYAKSVGADAILIVGFEPLQRGKPKMLKAKALKYVNNAVEHTI